MNQSSKQQVDKMSTENTRSRLATIEVTVPIIGLTYFATFATALIVRALMSGSVASYLYFFIPLAIASLLCAAAIWYQPHAGYIAAAVMSAILMAIFFLTRDGNDVITILSNPGANTVEFAFYMTAVPTFFSTFICSVLGLNNIRRRTKSIFTQKPAGTLQPSGVIGMLVLGFILGGLAVGTLAGASETRLIGALGTQTTQNDITIVSGAASPTNAQFYLPANLTVKVGTTVTWVNHDAAPHTVTSTTGAFDSGNMPIVAVYKFTFTQPGTYSYYCTYHTWMKGSVVVASIN